MLLPTGSGGKLIHMYVVSPPSATGASADDDRGQTPARPEVIMSPTLLSPQLSSTLAPADEERQHDKSIDECMTSQEGVNTSVNPFSTYLAERITGIKAQQQQQQQQQHTTQCIPRPNKQTMKILHKSLNLSPRKPQHDSMVTRDEQFQDLTIFGTVSPPPQSSSGEPSLRRSIGDSDEAAAVAAAEAQIVSITRLPPAPRHATMTSDAASLYTSAAVDDRQSSSSGFVLRSDDDTTDATTTVQQQNAFSCSVQIYNEPQPLPKAEPLDSDDATEQAIDLRLAVTDSINALSTVTSATVSCYPQTVTVTSPVSSMAAFTSTSHSLRNMASSPMVTSAINSTDFASIQQAALAQQSVQLGNTGQLWTDATAAGVYVAQPSQQQLLVTAQQPNSSGSSNQPVSGRAKQDNFYPPQAAVVSSPPEAATAALRIVTTASLCLVPSYAAPVHVSTHQTGAADATTIVSVTPLPSSAAAATLPAPVVAAADGAVQAAEPAQTLLAI